MTSTSCVAQRSARLIIQLQLLLKFHETDEALPLALLVVDRFCNWAMCQNFRALWIFVLPLLVVLVTPSAFAQSWVSLVTVTTTNSTATINWTTAVPATSRVKYGLTTSYGTLNGLKLGPHDGSLG